MSYSKARKDFVFEKQFSLFLMGYHGHMRIGRHQFDWPLPKYFWMKLRQRRHHSKNHRAVPNPYCQLCPNYIYRNPIKRPH